jgi:hypothetical protein
MADIRMTLTSLMTGRLFALPLQRLGADLLELGEHLDVARVEGHLLERPGRGVERARVHRLLAGFGLVGSTSRGRR